MAKIKTNKLLISLVIITVISFILGCLYISILSDTNQEIIRSSINSYFNDISSGKVNYLSNLYSIMSSNLLWGIFIWIIGVSIIGVIIVGGMLIFKSFLVGFNFVSIIYTYGFKGIISGLIYIFPEVLNLFIIFILTYYSMSFSNFLFKYLFRKKEFNKKVLVNRYLRLLVISIGLFIVTSLLSVFVIPNILRIF